MKICIKNATLVSMSSSRDKIENNVDILIEDDKISKIGKNLNIEEGAKIIDATDKVVMPGLINTHAHVAMSIFRETLDGYNLQDWLNKKIWPMEDKLTPEDVYYASYLSFIEMIETGCTTINDMYYMVDNSIRAMQETGIRLQTSRCLTSIGDGELRIKELEELVNNYNGTDNKLTFNVGIHGLYTCDEQYVQKCIEFAKKNNLYIHMHFCENEQEVKDIREIHGADPVDILKRDFGDIHTILAHCVKVSKEDIKKIKDMDISVAHCPVSNLKLGCGIANVAEMIEAGINVSLGTDGQGSGSNLDLFEAMKFTGLLQKGKTQDPEVMPAYEVLKMATVNGAKALNLQNEIGSIEEGKQADLIVLKLDNVETKPQNNLISEIVYNVKGRNVDTTIVAGNVLMENRKVFASMEKKELFRKCDEIIKRIS